MTGRRPPGLGSANGPLSDLLITEAGEGFAVSFCGKLLTDLGAAVVKVQRPGREAPNDAADAALATFLNANKYGVSLDSAREGGAEAFGRLAAGSDAVLAFSTLRDPLPEARLATNARTSHPALITVMISWFGQTGPWAEFECDEFLAQNVSGLSFATAMRVEDLVACPPLAATGHLAEMIGGLTAAAALVCAVFGRDGSGAGDEIDVAIVEAISSFLRVEISHYTYGAGVVSRKKEAVGPIASVGQQSASDGMLDFIIRKEPAWRALVDIIGNPAWAENELFATLSSRARYWDAIEPLFQADLQKLSSAYVFEEGQRRGIAVAPINTIAEAVQAPQFAERGFFIEGEHPERGRVKYPGPPARDPHTRIGEPSPAAAAGRDNDAILGDFLGLSEEEIREVGRQ